MSPTFPDLLARTARLRLDEEALTRDLVFAFAGSASGGLFLDALERGRVLPSSFEAEGFARDLFLEDFIRGCFQVSIRGRVRPLLTRVLFKTLSRPPTALEDVTFRSDILAELASNAVFRGEFENAYELSSRLRAGLENSSVTDQKAPGRRQLDILIAFRTLVNALAGSFQGATSGLERLRSWAEGVKSSEEFEALCELLRFDESAATLTFRVGIGSDGRVRRLALLKTEENTDNLFVNGPWRRWAVKLELLFRGFRMSDGEVLARLLDATFDGIVRELTTVVQLYGDLEFYLGALGFADLAREAGLPVSLPSWTQESSPRVLEGLFNPLLLQSGIRPVPCDLRVDEHGVAVLLTGPNSGGKTRLLQSVGLAQLLAQAGLFVPARRAQLARVPGLVVSLLQETRIDQTEGRLGVELVRIRSLFERLPPGAMVLLDELCSGTNPAEGEEIIELVLRMLARLRAQAFLTTHFLEFTARLERERSIPELRFLKVVLGPRSEPTYQFAHGVAVSSLAAEAAARLGVTGDQLLAIVEAKLRGFGGV